VALESLILPDPILFSRAILETRTYFPLHFCKQTGLFLLFIYVCIIRILCFFFCVRVRGRLTHLFDGELGMLMSFLFSPERDEPLFHANTSPLPHFNSLSGGGSRDVPPFLTLFRGGGPQSIPPFYVIPASVFAV
jgi:hypothetical protein